jgi:hypothetical protein
VAEVAGSGPSWAAAAAPAALRSQSGSIPIFITRNKKKRFICFFRKYYDSSDKNDNEGYTSNSDESYIDGENNDTIMPSEETYANATRKKDLKIYRMKDLLDKKKKLMFEKENEIKELGKQNSFLETVVHDYEKYNTVILEEKIKQKKALKILSDHIREISKNIKNDEFKLNRVKMDQTALLKEIQNIRDEIEYVLQTRGSNYISSDDDYQEESDY